MNKIFTIITLVFSTIIIQAQDNVGIGTLTPNSKALLDLESSDKGILVPRLSTAERLAITGLGVTERALLVFDTDLNSFYYWDATQWVGFPLDNDITNELQDLVLQNDSILISNGIGMDASALLDNTDEQNLTLSNDTIYIENGNWIYKPDNVNDADFDPSNEIQDLSMQNDSILINNGTGIDVSNLLDNTDDQNLTSAILNAANLLTINIEDGNSTSVDLSSLANTNTQSSDHDWYELGTTTAPNNINDHIFTDGKVTIGFDENDANLNVENGIIVSRDNSNTMNAFSKGLILGDSNTVSNSQAGAIIGVSNTINMASAGLNIGNNNTYNVNSPSINVGSNNTIYGTALIPANIGSYNRVIGSASLNGGMVVGNFDTVIYSGWDNDLYVTGFDNNLSSSGSDNTMYIQGKNNYLQGSGNNRFAHVTGRNNAVRFSGSNNNGFVMGNKNDIYTPSSAYSIYVIGDNDTVYRNNNSMVFGFNNKLNNYDNNNFLFGESIEIGADHTLSIGKNINLTNNGVMALSDRRLTSNTLTSSTNYEFVSRFQGGYSLFSNGTLTSGVTLAAGGGAWANISDKNKKENFKKVNKQAVLQAVADFDIFNWNYISQKDKIRHIGPFAQDFYKAFNLGSSEKSIVTSDISGVNMVAIQALNEENQKLKSENEVMKKRLDDLEKNMAKLLKGK